MPPHKSGLKLHQQKKSMPPHKQNQKGSGPKMETKEEYRHDEFDESDEEDYNEDPNAKRQKLDHVKDGEPHEEIRDSSNSESTKTPPGGSKTPNAKGPGTPSPTTDKAVKHSDSTPDSTPSKPVSGKEGAEKCLSDFVEKEGTKYLEKLNRAVSLSESENHSIEELAKSGAMLSEQAEKIQELGDRLLSMSEDRFKKCKKRKTRPS